MTDKDPLLLAYEREYEPGGYDPYQDHHWPRLYDDAGFQRKGLLAGFCLCAGFWLGVGALVVWWVG